MDLHNIEKDIETTRNHLIRINIINEAKTLFEEYVSNEKQIFQDYLITGKFIKEVVQTIFSNKLVYKWASNSFVNNEEQLLWISRQLQKFLLKAEKPKLRGFNKKESTSSVIRTSLNFIDKKKNKNKYNKNDYQKEN